MCLLGKSHFKINIGITQTSVRLHAHAQLMYDMLVIDDRQLCICTKKIFYSKKIYLVCILQVRQCGCIFYCNVLITYQNILM